MVLFFPNIINPRLHAWVHVEHVATRNICTDVQRGALQLPRAVLAVRHEPLPGVAAGHRGRGLVPHPHHTR